MVRTGETLGASRALIEGDTWAWPLHGLRHPPEADATGWYLWTGELLQDPNFFQPWHLAHALDRKPRSGPLLEQVLPGERDLPSQRALNDSCGRARGEWEHRKP